MKRTVVLFSDEERGFAETQSAKLGMSLSGFIRHLLHQQVALNSIVQATQNELENSRALLQAEMQLQADSVCEAQKENFKTLVSFLNAKFDNLKGK